MIKHLVCLSTALAFIMFAGCNDEAAKGRVPVYKTTGQVKFVGSPVIGAIVTFAPQDKNQRAAVGRTNDDGEFTLTTYGANDGAAAGEYKVMIMLPDSGGSEPEVPVVLLARVGDASFQHDVGIGHATGRLS